MAVVSLLAQVADLKASQAAGAASSVMPSGVILPYGGATAPAGWLECNGQDVSQTDYADLFAALGSAYNTQLNPTTGVSWVAPSAGRFRVPDMRGMFLRGEGTPSGLDAVSVGGTQVDKTKKNALSATSSTPTVSGTTNIAHTHGSSSLSTSNTWDSNSVRINIVDRFTATYFGNSSAGQRMPHNEGGDDNFKFRLTVSGTAAGQSLGTTSPSLSGTVTTPTITIAGGDNETRPINRGVKYIIKV